MARYSCLSKTRTKHRRDRGLTRRQSQRPWLSRSVLTHGPRQPRSWLISNVRQGMPHAINIDGISESLFILQNLVHASPSFCRRHKISYGGESRGDFDWDQYFGWLKSLSCDHLIQVSTKLRMLEDILRANEEDVDFPALDSTARKGLAIGSFDGSKKVLTLRESWNKVIHATDTQLDWKEESDHEFWTGCVWLFGKKGLEEWKVALQVEPFARASARYLEALEGQVDWHHLYKYDR